MSPKNYFVDRPNILPDPEATRPTSSTLSFENQEMHSESADEGTCDADHHIHEGTEFIARHAPAIGRGCNQS
jgi:hypothetical protein